MLNFFVALQSFVTDRVDSKDKGATAVEYGLMVALIAVVIILAVTAIGVNLDAIFQEVATSLEL